MKFLRLLPSLEGKKHYEEFQIRGSILKALNKEINAFGIKNNLPIVPCHMEQSLWFFQYDFCIKVTVLDTVFSRKFILILEL